jgi:adenine phosphoribosyltransferase
MIQLVQNSGGNVAGIGFLIELGFLDGSSKLAGIPHEYLLKL